MSIRPIELKGECDTLDKTNEPCATAVLIREQGQQIRKQEKDDERP